MTKIKLLFVAAIGLAVLLAGCQSGVSKPAPEEKTPTELLIGSWYAVETELNRYGNRETNKIVLTLTPDRYIYHKVEYGPDGRIELGDTGWWSGGWMADETTITTTTQGWPDDADGRWPDPVSSEKNYYFSDDSDVLYVHDWNVEHPRNYERFVRRPGLHDISGTYVFSRDTNDWEWQSSYEISADSFVYETVVYARESRSGAASEHFRLTGDLRLEDYYMFHVGYRRGIRS